MQKEEEEDPKNIWKSNVLMSQLKRHRAEDCKGVRKIRCIKSTAEQKSFQKFQSSSSFQAEIYIHFPLVRCCPFPPLSLQQYLLVVHCNAGSFPQVSVPEGEVWAWGKGRRERESWGNGEKGLEDLSGLKSPARFQLTLVVWKQLPHESVNDFWGDDFTEAMCHPVSFS